MLKECLKDKVALITGGASGIGFDIAVLYAKCGAKVVIADLNIEAANAAAKKIRDEGGQVMSVSMNVGDEDQVNAGVDKAVQTYGSMDILVSNAGIQHIEAVDKLEFSSWRKMMNIHLDGAFLTSKACLKYMYESKKGGAIILMGSVHSKEASKLKAPYVTAKHGLIGLCKVIAKEGAEHNVRCNVICPGFVRTPLVDKQIPEQAKDLGISEEEVVKKVMLGNTVDGQFTSGEDIAKTALFFAAMDTNSLTGQSLIVSHGWFME